VTSLSPGTLWSDLAATLEDGGFVMPPLVAATFVLWYALGHRWLTLRRGARGDLRRLWATPRRAGAGGVLGRALALAEGLRARPRADRRPLLEEALGPVRLELERYRTVVRSVVTIAPLAGLLGTVAGMIETFDGLGDGALFAASGGVAGGIAQALLTTQMGLVVAVPGVIVGRLLDRKQRSLESDLDQLGALLEAAPTPEGV
jgi:biopolymer transport protein ExbB